MKTENQQCYCGNDNIEIRTETRGMEILGKKYDIRKQYCHCPQCGEEWVTPAQSKASTDQIIASKRRSQGFLAPEDIKALRERHGLTQKQAAAIFGGGENAFSKYERGEIYPTTAMDKLMQLFDNVPQAKNHLLINNRENIHISSVVVFSMRNKNDGQRINTRTLENLNLDKREPDNEVRRHYSPI